MSDMPILSSIIFLPLLGALGVAFLPSSRPSLIRFAALGVSLVTFALSLGMLLGIDLLFIGGTWLTVGLALRKASAG